MTGEEHEVSETGGKKGVPHALEMSNLSINSLRASSSCTSAVRINSTLSRLCSKTNISRKYSFLRRVISLEWRIQENENDRYDCKTHSSLARRSSRIIL
jgi:hypothetical protein